MYSTSGFILILLYVLILQPSSVLKRFLIERNNFLIIIYNIPEIYRILEYYTKCKYQYGSPDFFSQVLFFPPLRNRSWILANVEEVNVGGLMSSHTHEYDAFGIPTSITNLGFYTEFRILKQLGTLCFVQKRELICLCSYSHHFFLFSV